MLFKYFMYFLFQKYYIS